jgi:hypothetical protein
MQIKCPSCAKSLQVNEGLAGKKVKCPCGSIVAVPSKAPGTVAVGATSRPPAKTAASQPVAPAGAAVSAQGAFDQREVNSLFDELTAGDMVTKKASSVKKSKKKDPLDAHMTDEQKAHATRSKNSKGGASKKKKIVSVGFVVALLVIFAAFFIYRMMNQDQV